MKQIHINEINNGWLVSTPSEAPAIQIDGMQTPQQPADVVYCADMMAVTEYLMKIS
jgi:hypothetical protein